MTTTQTILVDVAKQNTIPPVWVKAGDQNSRFLRIVLTENGSPKAVSSGAGALAVVTRPDQLTNRFYGQIDPDDGSITIQISGWPAEVAGLGYCAIQIVLGDSILTSFSFELRIQGNTPGFMDHAFYVNSQTLTPGQYYLIAEGVPYSFTTTVVAPIGSVIAFNTDYSSAIIYQDNSMSQVVESGIDVLEQAAGTALAPNDLFGPPPTGYYDTSDATATISDIMAGKTAYTANGKITGTLQPPVLVQKTITENGDYIAGDEGADGYSDVMVDVPNLLVGLFEGTLQNITADNLSGLTQLHSYALAENRTLLSIELPDSVTQFEDYAIYYCNQLQQVMIGSGISSFGYQALAYCYNLQSITIKAVTPPVVQSNTFTSTNNCPIYVPAESVDAYKRATNWASVASRIQAIPA